MVLFDLEVARAQHRRERQRDEQRDEHAEGDDHGEGTEELADDAGEEDHRREDRDERQRRGDDGEDHFAAAVDGRGDRLGIDFFAVAEDVLQHHDGVVDHHPDQQQQRQHGERVERVAEEVDDADGAHQRDGNGQRDDQRGAQRAQEEPHHQGSEQRALDQVLLQRSDDFLDEDGIVGDDGDAHARRQLRSDLVLHPFQDSLDDGDGVGVGNLDDAQADGRFAIEAGELAKVGEPILDLRHVGQLDGVTALVAEDHAGEVVDAVELQVQLDERFGGLADDEAAGELDMLLGEGLVDVLRCDAVRRHACRQEIHADGAVAPPAQANLADAVDGLQPLLDGIERVLVELLLGAVALQGQPHDRLRVGFHLGHHRRVGILRQAAQDLVELGLHLVEGDVDVLFEREGDVDLRDARRGGGLDVLDARHRVGGGFDEVGDAGVDDVRVGPLHRRRHRDDGEFDVGKAVHTDALVGDEAEQHQHAVEHPRQDVALDGKLGQGHFADSALALAGFLAAPSCGG